MRTPGVIALCLIVSSCACEHRVDISGRDGYSASDMDMDVPDIPGACPGMSFTAPVALPQPMKVDILVVVDNSMSMAEEQDNLSKSFPLFLSNLMDPPLDPVTGLPIRPPVNDLHLGVVSSDMGTGGYSVESCSDPIDGDNGELLHEPNPALPGCDEAYPNYLSYESATPDDEEIEKLCRDFGCIATLGIDGCGFEQQLKAASRALIDHRDTVNAGFLRRDSYLVILFLTDEEDCSIAPGNEGIFDTLDSSLGHLNLRCFHHPYMIELLDTYTRDFQSLRTDPDDLLLSFFVGVPQGPACEGFGDEIPTCLDHPDMMERVDPVSLTRLTPSCVTSMGEAYPPRRFVQIAQEFGKQALVSSICATSYDPPMTILNEKMNEQLEWRFHRTIPIDATPDPGRVCTCTIPCKLVESLPDDRSCPEAKPCYEPDGYGTGCAPPLVDEAGRRHTLCEILQSGSTMEPCDTGSPHSCNDPAVTHLADGPGWAYMAPDWITRDGTDIEHPSIIFNAALVPVEGSNLYLKCCY
jgi:hypothetical protein